MTRLQAILETANRMITAGLDEIAVAEVLIEQLQENIEILKEDSEKILPLFPIKSVRVVCKNTGIAFDDVDDGWVEQQDVPNHSEEKAGW